MKDKKVLFMAQAAMIAAIYVALTVVLAPFSFSEIQVRVAEALTILPAFTPAAIPGLFIGCLIGNIAGGAVLPDIVFGSLATLIGAFFTWKLRNAHPLLAPVPPIVANTLPDEGPFVDPTAELARAAIRFCGYETVDGE